jgi:hypothetical protein
MNRFFVAVQIVLINLVPLWGMFRREWSPATTLALYWCESVVGIVLIALRILIHRSLTHKRGHYDGSSLGTQFTVEEGKGRNRRERTIKAKTFLGEFLMTSVVFSLAHAVFLVVLLLMIFPRNFPDSPRVDPHDVGTGLMMIGTFMLLGFAGDLADIRHRPFLWLRQMVEGSLGRMFVIHLAIIVGMFAMLFFHGTRNFFAVFMFLKMLTDIGSRLPRVQPSGKPPAWLAKRMKEPFAAEYEKKMEEERKRVERDELVKR